MCSSSNIPKIVVIVEHLMNEFIYKEYLQQQSAVYLSKALVEICSTTLYDT